MGGSAGSSRRRPASRPSRRHPGPTRCGSGTGRPTRSPAAWPKAPRPCSTCTAAASRRDRQHSPGPRPPFPATRGRSTCSTTGWRPRTCIPPRSTTRWPRSRALRRPGLDPARSRWPATPPAAIAVAAARVLADAGIEVGALLLLTVDRTPATRTTRRATSSSTATGDAPAPRPIGVAPIRTSPGMRRCTASCPGCRRCSSISRPTRCWPGRSADRNPIHMHALTATCLRLPKAIAHGMWLKARTLATLEGRLPEGVHGGRLVQDAGAAAVDDREVTTDHEGGDWGAERRRTRKSGKPHLAGGVWSSRVTR